MSRHLLKRGCRTIFSTHYHELMREYVKEPAVVIYHMGVIEQVGRHLLGSTLGYSTPYKLPRISLLNSYISKIQ